MLFDISSLCIRTQFRVSFLTLFFLTLFFTQEQQKNDMILHEFRRVCPGISSVSTEDAELLGSPLGHRALQRAFLSSCICSALPLILF